MSHNEVSTLPFNWNIPYRRNTFFTGREDILTRLHESLQASKTAALTQPQAISGLGGIGKTQTAVEYAFRYSNEYNAVLWTKADSREVLVSDFVSIADLLNLPEKIEQDQNRVLNAVKRWLQTNKNWLLILDNVEDLTMINDFIPPASNGHILLTTRSQATGATANNIEIEKMEPEEGALFLLRRAKLIEKASEEDYIKAKEISQEMDGLPLALDQAGAYIEETACNLLEYLELYHTERASLLQERGESSSDHPESVTVTFLLSFEKIKKANPAATDLLYLCAFLYHDNIPEEIITEGAPDLGPVLHPAAVNQLQLKKAIAELRKYSLVRRDSAAKMLSIHRLVQAVIKDGMDENIQLMWVERTVRAVNRAFPASEFATWQRCQRFLLHAQVCKVLIEQWNIIYPESARLLNQVSVYLVDCAQYTQAESFLLLELFIRKQIPGAEHHVATNLSNLASIYYEQGKYSQVEPLLQQALSIYERSFGSEHYLIANSLNSLGATYQAQGKYDKAELVYQRALTISKKDHKLNHRYETNILSNLATLYEIQGKFSQAEALFKQVLTKYEKTLGSKHPDVANSLSNLATLYEIQGKYIQAEPLFQRATALLEQALGPDHPDVAIHLNNLAQLYAKQGKHDQAELFYKRSLDIREKTLGIDHPAVATCLNNLGNNYYAQGNYDQAQQVLERALEIRERALGPNHDEVATTLNNLAILYHTQGKQIQAEYNYKQALTIRQQRLEPDHHYVVQSLKNYASFLRDIHRDSEAARLEAEARRIRSKHPQENSMSIRQFLESIKQ